MLVVLMLAVLALAVLVLAVLVVLVLVVLVLVVLVLVLVLPVLMVVEASWSWVGELGMGVGGDKEVVMVQLMGTDMHMVPWPQDFAAQTKQCGCGQKTSE